MLVFEGPSSIIFKRLSPFFADLELHSSRNLDQTVVCGLSGKPVDSPSKQTGSREMSRSYINDSLRRLAHLLDGLSSTNITEITRPSLK